MFTQCPHCLTLFRVHAEHLKVAQGKVRCNQCQQIFNAVEYLQEESTPIRQAPGQQVQNTATLPIEQRDESSSRESPVTPTEQSAENEADENPPVASVADTPAEEAVLTIDDEAPGETIDNEDYDLAEETTEFDRRDELSLELSGQLPDIEPAPDTEVDDVIALENEPRGRAGTWIGFISVVILTVVLIIQSLWWYRDKLIYHDQTRLALETLCRITGCVLPERRALGKLQILHRDFSSHPSLKDTLLLRLTLVNRAEFPQPFPTLQLGLLDDNDRLVAQRRFLPSDYLAESTSVSRLMDSDIAIDLNLELIDPGVQATGFRFEFF